MTTAKNITDFIHSFCPPSLAFDGDNVGLIIGRADKEVSKILITLDVDEAVADEAKSIGADMIVSHHPLMFYPIKRLTDSAPEERTIAKLIAGDIPLLSAHTNMDCVKGGLNDYLAQKLGIIGTSVIDVVASDGTIEHGFGRLGCLPKELTLAEMIDRCKQSLGTPFVKYTGDLQRKIKTVAVNCGSGADLIDVCIKKGTDLFITGDVKYNPARDSSDAGMALIDAGHYETEHIVCELFVKLLKKEYPHIEFFVSSANTPVWNYR